jgi:hypothetical protein
MKQTCPYCNQNVPVIQPMKGLPYVKSHYAKPQRRLTLRRCEGSLMPAPMADPAWLPATPERRDRA